MRTRQAAPDPPVVHILYGSSHSMMDSRSIAMPPGHLAAGSVGKRLEARDSVDRPPNAASKLKVLGHWRREGGWREGVKGGG